MLCVETIGKIRRRRLVQGESISAIARDLGLARNTVKRALRFEGEGYEYRRVRQPMPKLGPYLSTLDAWLEVEETLPARERRTAQRLYEGLCLEGYTGAVDGVRRNMRELRAPTPPGHDGVHPADLRARRGLPVRLEPRARRARRRRPGRQGRARSPVPQPRVLPGGVSAREPGDGVRLACAGVRVLWRRAAPWDLRQPEAGGRRDLGWPGAAV